MATKPVYLTVPAPCPQRWQDMENEAAGRYCAGCQKTVVDFTALTDQQLISLLAQPNGSGCGRFRASQLNRALAGPVQISPAPVRLFSLLTVGLLGYQPVQANPMPTLANPMATHASQRQPGHPVPSAADETPPADSVRVITGRVVEAVKGAGIPGVAVIVKGTSRGASTDADGRFQVIMPTEAADKPITLQLTSIGYLSQEIVVLPAQSTPLLISLAENTEALSQEVIMGYYIRR